MFLIFIRDVFFVLSDNFFSLLFEKEAVPKMGFPVIKIQMIVVIFFQFYIICVIRMKNWWYRPSCLEKTTFVQTNIFFLPVFLKFLSFFMTKMVQSAFKKNSNF